MVRPRSQSPYALRQLKSPLSNISSLGLAGLKSTGIFVILGVTRGQVTGYHLSFIDNKHHPRWGRRAAVSKRGLKGALVVVDEVIQSRIYKPLWWLDALLTTSTLTIFASAVGLFLR